MNTVSIIIPTFNNAERLEKCVDSVYLCFKGQIECIIVDDGSTDNTQKVLDSLGNKYEGLILLKQNNKGVSAARNLALSKASGEYISFIDADDYINKVNLDFLNSENDLYVLGTNMIEGNYNKNIHFVDKGLENNFIKYPVFMGAVWNKFFKAKIIKKYDIKFNEKFWIYEDNVFVVEYLMHTNDVVYVDEEYYNYVYNQNSATNKRLNKQIILDRYNVVNYIEEILRNNGKFNEFSRFVKYKRLYSILPLLTNSNTFDIETFKKMNKSNDIWTYSFNPAYFLITFAAKYNIYWLIKLIFNFKTKFVD